MKTIIYAWGISFDLERRTYREQGNILFNKYIILKTLHSTKNTEVFLSKHIGLDDKRIIKKLIKSPLCEENYRREISVLKSFKHNGIPIVYDVVEEQDAYFIIEEYIEGVNLFDYVKDMGKMPEEMALNFALQLSEIMVYLHGRKPMPVLHLDLKPHNIIIRNGKVYLVDFGNSMFMGTDRKYISGTKGYAAPEQYGSGIIDMSTDIYGLGALMYFMVTGQTLVCEENLLSDMGDNISQSFKEIIIQCMSPKKNRVSDALWVAENLNEIIQKKLRKKNIKYEYEKLKGNPLVISVVGTRKHIGVTHFCLALTSRLMERGINTVYEDSGGKVIKAIYNNTSECILDCGIYYYSNIMMRYLYNGFIALQKDVNCRVIDCCDFDSMKEILANSDTVIVIAAGKPWELDDTKEMLLKIEKVCDGSKIIRLWNFVSGSEDCIPVFFEPIERNADINKFFDMVINKIIEEDNVYKEKRKKGIFGFLTRKSKC